MFYHIPHIGAHVRSSWKEKQHFLLYFTDIHGGVNVLKWNCKYLIGWRKRGRLCVDSDSSSSHSSHLIQMLLKLVMPVFSPWIIIQLLWGVSNWHQHSITFRTVFIFMHTLPFSCSSTETFNQTLSLRILGLRFKFWISLCSPLAKSLVWHLPSKSQWVFCSSAVSLWPKLFSLVCCPRDEILPFCLLHSL